MSGDFLQIDGLAKDFGGSGWFRRSAPVRAVADVTLGVPRGQTPVTVDKIEMGEAREHDSRGRPLPVWQGCRVVAEGDVFLMNWQSAASLDGRYFGTLPVSSILGRAEPLWTGEDE